MAQTLLNNPGEPLTLLNGSFCQSVALVFGDIGFGYMIESVGGTYLGGMLIDALLFSGVHAVRKLTPGFVPPFSHLLEANLWISAERELFFLHPLYF